MSLLLDALKKAAEEKLAAEDSDATAVEGTQVDSVLSKADEAAVETKVDQDITSYDLEVENEKPEEKVSSSDLSSASEGGLSFDDTQIGEDKNHREDTEINANTNMPTIIPEANLDEYNLDTTMIGGHDAGAINLDEKNVSITLTNQPYVGSTSVQEELNKTSMTDNFLKKGYNASPEMAGQVLGAGYAEPKSKTRFYALLGLGLLAGLMFLGLYGYEYYSESGAQDYKLSYQQLKKKNNGVDKARNIQSAATNQSTKRKELTKVDIVVEEKNYNEVLELDARFNATAAKAEVLKAKAIKKPVKSIKPATVKAKKPIKIQKQQLEPLSNVVLRAYDAYNDGDLQTAKSEYESVLRRQGNNRDALLGLAAISISQNDPETARAIYARLLAENPSDAQAASGITALGPTGQSTQAVKSISDVKSMLKQRPNSSQLYFTLGNLYADESRWAEAQKAFFKAYSLDETNPDYLYNLAVSLDYLGKAKAALPFYQKALVQSGLRQSGVPISAAEQRINAIVNQ